MANTIITYVGTGSTNTYTVPFDYLAKKFVRITLGDADILTGGNQTDPTADYYFQDANTIYIKTAPPSGEYVTVRRYTSATERIVSFKDGSVLKAKDLDTSTLQNLHIAEEARDVINDALVKDNEGNWDAKDKTIINVKDPENPYDVVNKKYVDTLTDKLKTFEEYEKINTQLRGEVAEYHEDVLAKANQATASASTAVEAMQVVVSNRQETEKLATEVETLHTDVVSLAESAEANAKTATEKATQASKSEATAKTYEAMADTSAQEAKDWANKLDGTVDDSEYSSKYYAQEAKKQADNSSSTYANITNTVNTAISTINSKLDETTSQANIAKENATIATTQATEATTQATKASASANTATAKATLATTKAEEASSYANNAKDEALRAKDYANQASQKQINSDWDETNPNEKGYIKNKPDIYTKAEVDTKLTAVYKYKGSVDTKSDLPKSGMEVGWTYNIKSNGANYSWDGSTWDELGATIDLSPYATSTEVTDKLSNYLPLSGGTLTGNLMFSSSTVNHALLSNAKDNGAFLETYEANGNNPKTRLVLRAYNHATRAGWFELDAKDSTNSKTLIGKPNGVLIWGSDYLIRSINNIKADYLGNVSLDLSTYATKNLVESTKTNILTEVSSNYLSSKESIDLGMIGE